MRIEKEKHVEDITMYISTRIIFLSALWKTDVFSRLYVGAFSLKYAFSVVIFQLCKKDGVSVPHQF